jgi:hypothetical protein
MIVSALLAAASFGAVFYAADALNDSGLVSLFSIMCMISMAMVMLVGGLRLYVSRCPECKTWISRQRPGDSNVETLKFPCKACAVVWDSGIKVDS